MRVALNDVRIYGQVMGKPTFVTRRGETVPHKAVVDIKTISRYHNSSDVQKIKYDPVTIMTRNLEMISQIADLNQNDMVLLKGLLCTLDVMSANFCEGCGEEYQIKSTQSYVYPIHLMVLEKQVPDDRGYMLLQQHAEISNECIVYGRVVTDVAYSEEYRNANYKLAVKRSFRIPEDGADKKIDYPVICSYFEQAKQDSECLQRGSFINVRGSIRVREFERNVMCPACGLFEKRTQRASELVASYIGYVKNWKEPVRTEEEEEVIINGVESWPADPETEEEVQDMAGAQEAGNNMDVQDAHSATSVRVAQNAQDADTPVPLPDVPDSRAAAYDVPGFQNDPDADDSDDEWGDMDGYLIE